MDREFFFDRNLAYDVRILRVIDGDSVVVEIDDDGMPEARGHDFNVRLAGIDAPELSQPQGSEAKQTLERLLRRKVGLVVLGTDRHRRNLGVLLFYQRRGPLRADDSVNREMARLGMASWSRQYADAETIGLEEAESEAKSARRGVWSPSGANGERPWEHRIRQRADRTSKTRPRSSSGCLSVVAALAVAMLISNAWLR